MQKCILVFGGTTEARRLVEAFVDTELKLHICVATDYGASVLPKGDNVRLHVGRLDEEGMESLMSRLGVSLCIDATHPYAVEVTENIMQACHGCKVEYKRIIRESEADELSVGDNTVFVDSVEEAVHFLQDKPGKIFIATGSKELEKYTELRDYRNRCVARVLPLPEVLRECGELGFCGGGVIAMQGPFDEELNTAMLRQSEAAWMVTKESGSYGGFTAKVRACRKTGCGLVVVGRPEKEDKKYALSESELLAYLEERYGCKPHSEKKLVSLVGVGPGAGGLLTAEAETAIKNAQLLIGADRVLDIVPVDIRSGKMLYSSYKKEDIAKYLAEHHEYDRVAVLYSGDIGFFSGARDMEKYIGACKESYEIERIPGISSVQYFLDKLGIDWSDVVFKSAHGRSFDIVRELRRHRYVCALVGDAGDVAQYSNALFTAGFERVRITVGERLSYPDEKIFTVDMDKAKSCVTDRLSVVLYENEQLEACVCPSGAELSDGSFVRGAVPMTKQEIRTLSVAKLGLTEDAVVYDVGAGTGSVSVALAKQCPYGRVYAIEKNPEGIGLIEENARKHGASNIVTVPGQAPECMEALPAPTHVFIGGSSKRLMDIVDAVLDKNISAKIVINSVTLETTALMGELGERVRIRTGREADIVQVSVARGKRLGGYHIMEAENPVYIISI